VGVREDIAATAERFEQRDVRLRERFSRPNLPSTFSPPPRRTD
jgi:hypothetical protein